MHEEQPKGPLRYFAAAVMALVLCTTAALAVENGERSLIPVGHTVGVKLFSRGVVVVKLPEGHNAGPGLRLENRRCDLGVRAARA